jgi:hypothetical protein
MMNNEEYDAYMHRMEQRDRQRTGMLGAWMFMVLGGPSLIVAIVFALFAAGMWAVTPAEPVVPCADKLARAQRNAGEYGGHALICNSEGAVVSRPAVTLDNGRFTEH